MNCMISEYISVSEVKVGQSHPALCDPMDYTVCGILQARILEWVAFSFSRASSQSKDWTQVSCFSSTAGLFLTCWAIREAQYLIWMWSESESCSVMFDSLWPRGLYSLWNSPGQNTGVGRLSLLQGIFPTEGSNPDLSHCRQILYQLSHKGSPFVPHPGIKPMLL